ncbi:MAG: hypothetical protein SXV54_27285 [Chloroflexota bacterium]|nr:hypothetical protein [Chloroflexota bacterium]
MTVLHHSQAAEPQMDTALPVRAVEPLCASNDTGAIERLSCSAFSAPSVTRASTGTWHIETLDGGADVGKFTSLALDSLGRAHISYSDWDDASDKYDLKYVWHDGTSWQIETVDGEGWSEYSSLALDGSDRPRISYYDYGNLGYAWRDGAIWHIETVDSKGGYYTSLALDSAGQPHISYQGNFGDLPDVNWDLKYAWHDGAGWRVETVDDEGDVGFNTSLALDGAGWPHISYYDYALNNVKYAWYDGTSWHIEVVDSVGGSFNSLALDGSGRPHISYYSDAALKYAWHDGVSWHIEAVDSVVGFTHTSLALDGLDRPHISYGYNSDLKYAWYDGANWHIETVDSPHLGACNSLALDESGWPHISYSGGGLKYAHLAPVSSPPLSLGKQATPDDNVRNNDILTYTLTLYGPGLSVRLWDPLPDAVYYVTGSITGTIVPAASYSSTAKAIVWEGTLPTDTVQTIRFRVTPGITGTGSLSLSFPIVNTAWLTCTESGRSVSALAIVNGRRVYLPLVVRSR